MHALSIHTCLIFLPDSESRKRALMALSCSPSVWVIGHHPSMRNRQIILHEGARDDLSVGYGHLDEGFRRLLAQLLEEWQLLARELRTQSA